MRSLSVFCCFPSTLFLSEVVMSEQQLCGWGEVLRSLEECCGQRNWYVLGRCAC